MIKVVTNLRLNETDKKILELCKELKLSVSGVKYSRGHDGDCMNANLKVGNRIKGEVFDDSWGGGLQYFGDNFYEFEERINKVLKQFPNVDSQYGQLTNCIDLVVDLLIGDFEVKKDSKKKTVFLGSKVDNPKRHEIQQYSFNGIVDQKVALLQLESKGFKVVEFI